MFKQIQDVKAESLAFIKRIGTNLEETASFNHSIVGEKIIKGINPEHDL